MSNNEKQREVIIAGSPRSGKTTLARMIKKETGYSHYKLDVIKRAIWKIICPERNNDWEYASYVVSKMIVSIAEDNDKETMQKDNIIFDTPHVFPKDLKDIDRDKFVVVFLGYTEVSIEEKVKFIREHDCETCWTHTITDMQLRELVRANIEYSKIIKQQCEEYNFPYFDVSYNTTEVLEEVKLLVKKSIFQKRD